MTPASLLPHTGCALLLSRVIRHGDGALEAEATIANDYPLARHGRTPSLVGIEIGAQAAGALEALTNDGHGTPTGGRLVRIESATFHCDALPTQSIIDVSVVRDARLPPLSRYRVAIRAAGTLCVDCTISIFLLG